jgi:hypothetical protein
VEGFFPKYFERKKWSKRSKEIYQAVKDQHVDDRWTGFLIHQTKVPSGTGRRAFKTSIRQTLAASTTLRRLQRNSWAGKHGVGSTSLSKEGRMLSIPAMTGKMCELSENTGSPRRSEKRNFFKLVDK